MAETYGTTLIPSDEVTVQSGGTVSVNIGVNAVVGVVGHMDTGNGSASEGSVVEVKSPSDAQDKFGDGSELHEAVKLIYANGAEEVWAYPLETTNTTESFGGASSGTLSNLPASDPRVTTRSITAQDTVAASSVSVNIVYDTPSTPSSSDTINLNPITGAWEADASSDYDITYDYPTIDSSVFSAILGKSIRILVFLSEHESSISTMMTEVSTRASDFDLVHAFAGATPETSSPSSYTDSLDERRLSLVAPSRYYRDDADSVEVRTASAVAGLVASKTLGDTTTYESLSGLSGSPVTSYTNSEHGDWISAQVLPVKKGDRVFVVKDMTTSTDSKFERVYNNEIVDEAVEISHQIAQQFIGELNKAEERDALRDSHVTSYRDLKDDDLLDAFSVNVSEGANADEVDVEIGLNVVDVMDIIDVTVTVGNIITQETN